MKMEMDGFQTCALLFALTLTLCSTLNGINSLPIEDAENPVAQLKQLAAKLVIVEQALENLNQDINSYVISNDPTQHVIKSTKRSSLSAPQMAAPAADQTLDNFMLQLSLEDQAVLQHMKSKVKYLQAVLHEPAHSPNPGEETPNIQAQKKSQIPISKTKEFLLDEHKRSPLPSPPVPDEVSDQELQTFKQQLSPEDQELLKKMSYKLKYLQGTLHEPAHGPNPNETPDVTIQTQKKSEIPVNKARIFQLDEHKRSPLPSPPVPDEVSDQELQTFKQQLSPEDQELLKKMSYKLKFLQGVLHEPAHGPNPNETPDVQIMKKSTGLDEPDQSVNEDQILANYIAGLSPDDQALLKKNKNKLQMLQAVLHEPKQSPNPGENNVKEKREEVEEETNKKTSETDNEDIPHATDKAIIFTAEDREMLQTIRVKLDELKKSLQEFKINHPPAQATAPVYITPHKGEGEFGQFVQVRSKRGPDTHWHDSPFDETILGLDKKCVGKACIADKVVKKCEACDCEDGDCDCDCTDSETKLSKRVLSNVKSVASEKMNLKQLLSALSHVRAVRQRRTINLDQELDEMRGP